MSAERNRSKGAPFLICAKKFPDEPLLVFNVTLGCELVNSRFSSSRQNTRSDAAAMYTVSAPRPEAVTNRKANSSSTKRPAILVHEADEVIRVGSADSGQIEGFYGNRVEAGRRRAIHEG